MKDIQISSLKWFTLASADSTEALKDVDPLIDKVSAGSKGRVEIKNPRTFLGLPAGWMFDMALAEQLNSHMVPKGAEIRQDLGDDVYYDDSSDTAYIEFHFGSSETGAMLAVTTTLVILGIASAIIAIAVTVGMIAVKAYLPDIVEGMGYIPAIGLGFGGFVLTAYGMISGKDYWLVPGVALMGGGGYLGYRESQKD